MIQIQNIVFVVLLIVFITEINGAYGPKYQKNSKKDYKIKEKDLKQAKARWIQLQKDDWDDDMMQRPIDEPPRRVRRFIFITKTICLI